MKSLFISLLLLVNFQIFSQFVEKPFEDMVHSERAAALKRMLSQPLANTGNYDVKFHRISLSPSMTTRHLSGEVTTYFEPIQNLGHIEFDFTDQMTVSSVFWHNQNLNFTQNNDVLNITFPQNLASGVLDSVKISYNGNVPAAGLGAYTVTTHNGKPVVWTLSEPYGAKEWWPCKQDLIDKVDSVEVVLQYPKTVNGDEMIGVSNGLIVSEEILTDSETNIQNKITVWKHRYPIAAYLVAFAITNYTKFSQTAGVFQNFPIDNYVYPEDLANAQAESSNFLPVMNYFENTFGHYPFHNEKYGQIQFGWGGGMEHQTATFVVNYSRPLIAHELAHQWFGDAVTCGSWHDIWLNEGFATYSEALTREALNGQNFIDNWKQQATSFITSELGGAVYVEDTTRISRIFDSRLSYRKGAMALNMLRLKVGDQHFFQGIRQYVIDKSFQYVKTTDFRTVMETESGLDLQEFFNDWIFGEGYPTYQININKIGNGQYDVEVSQTTSHPSVSFFEMPLPFTFSDNNGHTFDIILDNTTNAQHFTVDIGFDVTQVDFDPHFDIVKGPTQLNTALRIGEDVLSQIKIFPNPVKSFFSVEANEQNLQKVSIFTSDGKLVKTLENHFNQIEVNDLAKGIYFVEIKTDKGTITQRMIKS